MNRRTIAIVGVVALIVVGIGIAWPGDDPEPPVSGERPNPFGETTLPADDPIGSAGPTLPPIGTVGPTLPTTTQVLDPSEAVLLYAQARVTLGSGARYVYLGDPNDRTRYNEAVRETLASVDGAEGTG